MYACICCMEFMIYDDDYFFLCLIDELRDNHFALGFGVNLAEVFCYDLVSLERKRHILFVIKVEMLQVIIIQTRANYKLYGGIWHLVLFTILWSEHRGTADISFSPLKISNRVSCTFSSFEICFFSYVQFE